MRFVARRKSSSDNLQLHPPVGYDDSIVVNTLGNLDMSEVKVLEARLTNFLGSPDEVEVTWVQIPPERVQPIRGRTRALPYTRTGRTTRPSRLSTAADFAVDLEELRRLIPSVEIDDLIAAITTDIQVELMDSDDETEG